MSKRTGISEGTALGRPVLEYHWKKDDLNDPLLTEEPYPRAGSRLRESSLPTFASFCLHVNELLAGFMPSADTLGGCEIRAWLTSTKRN